jgi:putative phage-type endonuclease
VNEKLIYTERELPQRSAAWNEIRKTCIGGSDTGTLLSLLTKYEKPKTWWRRKLGKIAPKTETDIIKYGAEMEPEAKKVVREHLRNEEGIKGPKLHPYFVIHPDYRFIGISFDGVDRRNKFITELKCPKFSSVFRSVFENGIQDYYYCQVQLQLEVAYKTWGITKAYYASYFPQGCYIWNREEFIERYKTLAVIDAEYDPEYCKEMIKILKLIWEFVETKEWDTEKYNSAINKFKKLYANGI